MLACTQSEDEDISLEACEFWLALAEQEEAQESLKVWG